MSEPIKMIKEDVYLSKIEWPVCAGESDGCTFDVTHSVMLDVRATGIGHSLGDYCETCATAIMKRIQESLPEEANQ